jgi:hypothetical protein
MSDTLSKHQRVRPRRWLAFAAFCSHLLSPWHAAFAQTEAAELDQPTEPTAKDAATKDGSESGDEASLAEADAAAMDDGRPQPSCVARRRKAKGWYGARSRTRSSTKA